MTLEYIVQTLFHCYIGPCQLEHLRSQPRLTTMYSCLVGVDDVYKRGLQASTSDKEAIDIRLLSQLIAVLLRHTAAIQDARLVRRLARDLFLEPLAERGMDFLGLLGGRDFAGSNGPANTLASDPPPNGQAGT
jgi:hypothetical protein